MAIMCYKGEGVPRDYERAKLYLQESADTDDPQVQYYLALIYSEGDKNVPRNEEEAVEYAAMAAEQGHDGAKELLKKLGR